MSEWKLHISTWNKGLITYIPVVMDEDFKQLYIKALSLEEISELLPQDLFIFFF
jgi:hypothetical protein